MVVHHLLDPWPIPKDRGLYINEPWLLDPSLLGSCEDKETMDRLKQPDASADNVRIYLPMDLNAKAIIRRLDAVIAFFGVATEKNEFDYGDAVDQIIWQLEIYDWVHYLRNISSSTQKHSAEGLALVKTIIERLAKIPDGCAEHFPFELIEELRQDYLKETDPDYHE